MAKYDRVLLVGFLLTLLPIWRQGSSPGMNVWQILSYTNRGNEYAPFGQPHVSYEAAKAEARKAYINPP